jgi:hypothetical protein
MRDGALKVLFLAMLTLGIGACSEPTSRTETEDVLGLEFAVSPGPCDLMQTIAADSRSVFGRTEEAIARPIIRDMGTACTNANQALVASYAWNLLGMVETALDGNLIIGTAAQTAAFVGRLVACTTSLCEAAAVPSINFTSAVSPYGIFAVRSDDVNPAIARGAVPFTDVSGQSNAALWGVEVDFPWSVVTSANPVLVYGGPVVSGGLTLKEIGLGNVQYLLNVLPDAGEFLDGALHVGACFAKEVTIPPSANGLEARMQREGVLLEEDVPGFCPPDAGPQAASIIAPFVAFARRVMPASITSLLVADTKVRVVGGTPLDFSTFAPVAAETLGTLEWLSVPPAVVVAGDALGEIKVKALSGAGTPMEKVRIELYIAGNQGTPAGAVLLGDIESYTQERSGVLGVATFPDEGADGTSVGKAGGYTICARGFLSGFAFTDICTSFNARNPS